MPTPDEIRSAIDAGQRPHAVRLVRDAATTADEDEWLKIADVLVQHGMFAPLVDAWRRRKSSEREAAPLANALNAVALAHLEEGRTDDAIRHFDEAIALAPALRYVRRNLASALLQTGEFEGALTCLHDLLREDASDPETLLLLGVTHYQAGDPQLAIEPLSQAGTGADALLWLLKAQVTTEAAGALDTLQRLVSQHPDRAPAMLASELHEPGSPLHTLADDPRAKPYLGDR